MARNPQPKPDKAPDAAPTTGDQIDVSVIEAVSKASFEHPLHDLDFCSAAARALREAQDEPSEAWYLHKIDQVRFEPAVPKAGAKPIRIRTIVLRKYDNPTLSHTFDA